MPANGSDLDNDSDAIIIHRGDVSDYNPEQILPLPRENIQKIRAWLQPTSYDIAGGEYRKHIASHVAGTGAWLSSSAAYLEWLKSAEHGLLWIKGFPGSGKSVMAANLIDEIAKSNPGSPVLFFFFRQIIEANHEPRALLRDWMDQVLGFSPPLQTQLNTYVKACRSIESVSIEDMWKDLKMAFVGLSEKVFCVVDALDEMDRGHDTFIQALGSLGQWRPEKVKVLITSRPVPSVEGPLRQIPCLHLRLQEALVDVDISTFVQFALSKSTIPQSDWQVIADAVPGRANGLFIYAKLAMDAFLEPGADINSVLMQLPTDLNVLYTELLKEHAQRSGVAANIQHLILQFVTHASRPLRLLELAEMIRVINPDGFERDLKATKDLIKAACGPLLEILADETVSVIHHSFTEYLKGTTRSDDDVGYPILQMGSTHAQLALVCLRYLQAGCLDAVRNKANIKDNDIDTYFDHSDFYSPRVLLTAVPKKEIRLRLKYPFFEYGAGNWHHHIRRSEAAGYDQTEVNIELRNFLGDAENMNAWLEIKWPGRESITQVHIAAKGGLVSYTKELLETMEVDAQDESGKTPLWWAASEGHAAAIRELVAAGANPDHDDKTDGLKPLHMAAKNNRPEAVKALLEAGVDPLTRKTQETPPDECGNVYTTIGITPLMYACHGGHAEAVEAFLPFLKDIDAVHRALMWAVEKGSSKLVARILQHPGVDVNATVRGDTPLYHACDVGDVATVTALLQAGADPNILSVGAGNSFPDIDMDDGDMEALFQGYEANPQPQLNCLHRLCGVGCGLHNQRFAEASDLQTMFSLLVQAGVDVNQRTSSGQTALHFAVESPVLVKLLLDAGADANAIDCHGSAPLHKVKSMDSMVLLIENGHANIDLAQANGLTPLLCLLPDGRSATILKLLEYGPNCNVLDDKGNGVLHISLEKSPKLEIIKTLLKGGADPNLKNREGTVPQFSLRNGSEYHTEIMDLLLDAGADINAVGKDGATLWYRLLSTSQSVHGKVSHKDLTDLVDRGASTSVRDFNGRTGFHQAVKFDNVGISFRDLWKPNMIRFDFLVGLGLDTQVVDYRGNSLLHELALRECNHPDYGKEPVLFWERLIGMGLDLEQRNHAGRTPLHILCATRSRRFRQGVMTALDFVISRTKNLDIADNDSITPLHIAVTGGELCTKKLLDAGANPAVVTYEGLTPLHLASRCRESNVVGLLLDALRSKQKSPVANNSSRLRESGIVPLSDAAPSPEPVIGVNARAFGRFDDVTPLFYACRSGRPETVTLLLEAGADVRFGTIFHALIGFEQENELWKTSYRPADDNGCGDTVALKLHDISRPITYSQSNRKQHEFMADETTRLEEILDMLIKHGADISQLAGDCWTEFGEWMNDPVHTAAKDNRDYTVACLRGAWDKNHSASSKKRTNGTTVELFELMDHARRKASVQTLGDTKFVEPGDNNQWLLCRFLTRREYHLVEELFHLGVDFLSTSDQDEPCNFAVLVLHGFASLVEKIGTLEAESRLEKGDWHAFGDKTRPGLFLARKDMNRSKNPVPFLLEAVKRELPNMDVVRLLVERFGVPIHEPTLGYSALHYVAQGKSWWHAHQALPYLLKAGADVQIRDGLGRTPLHLALKPDRDYSGLFHTAAAEAIIEAGADVNAVDKEGRSCLARAQNDIAMIRLLKAHRATVTASAIFAALDALNVGALDELLSGEVDADMRRDRLPEDLKEGKRNCGDGLYPRTTYLESYEESPLYHIAERLHWPTNPTQFNRRVFKAGLPMVQILLDHGADPFAKFLRKPKEYDSEYCKADSKAQTPSINVPQGYEELTTLHELLLKDRLVVDTFLHIPELDVNHRDAKGRTLLHVSCQGDSGPDYVLGSHEETVDRGERVTVFHRLISLGADLEARDNFGRNVLHCMTGGRNGIWFNLFEDAFTYALNNAPNLVNQADDDGMTPLQYAVSLATKEARTDVREIELLLSAGADPLVLDRNCDTLLHLLARKLKTPALRGLFKDLVQRGADVNARNAQGETPLFAFCKRVRTVKEEMLEYYDCMGIQFTEKDAKGMLEELGADFFARDAKGRGLMHIAANGDVRRFKELMDTGLDVMLEDNAQQTPIDVAAACGNLEVLELFEKKD
ncbi:putative ankyrin repeat protein [Ilyonectria destructans]|nr:putative ankyrin repeat protein [Ilyonectria destructans]